MTEPSAESAPDPGLVGHLSLPDRLFVIVPEHEDPYSVRPGVTVKTFALRRGQKTGRIGIRQGNHRGEAVLTAALMRELADDLYDRADLIDPEGATTP